MLKKLNAYYSVVTKRSRDKLLGFPRRSNNEYATHVPYLVGAVGITRAKRVLEIGCGLFSTLTFLDRTACPSVEVLDSYEDDPEWFESMMTRVGGDARANLQFRQSPLAATVEQLDLADYDLILVDDSRTREERTGTLHSVFSRWTSVNVALVHDFEISEYRHASACPLERLTFNAYCPCTGALWRKDRLDRTLMRELKRTVAKNSARLDVADAQGWRQVFAQSLSGFPA
jgi:hypothetical protein